MAMVEMGKFDFSDERALRAWCFEGAATHSCGLTERLETAEKIYRFIVNEGIADVKTGVPSVININLNAG